MAKANPMKEEAVLREAKQLAKPTDKWTGEHHRMLIWNLFRTELGYNPPKDKIAEFGKKWTALFDNGSLGYASNTGKRLADAGVTAPDVASTVSAEYK